MKMCIKISFWWTFTVNNTERIRQWAFYKINKKYIQIKFCLN